MALRRAECAVWVVWSAFEMRAHQEVDVFDGDGALWRGTMECRRNPAYSVRTANPNLRWGSGGVAACTRRAGVL